MFNAESLIDVIRDALISTEAETTRKLAEEIRHLPASYPPSEIADTLDAAADAIDARHEAAAPTAPVNIHSRSPHWRHVDCPSMNGPRNVLNPANAEVCKGCGQARQELERGEEVEVIP